MNSLAVYVIPIFVLISMVLAAMSLHIDNIHHSHGQSYGYPQSSVLLFLNDDYEGGEIIVAGNTYKPAKGSALVFPSNFMFPHEVKKVTEGERWSVVSWLM